MCVCVCVCGNALKTMEIIVFSFNVVTHPLVVVPCSFYYGSWADGRLLFDTSAMIHEIPNPYFPDETDPAL